MAASNLRPALRAWRSYGGAGTSTRAFLAARLAVIPLGKLDSELRGLSGRVLSLGPGHGILERYIAELNPSVEIEGAELDGERVRTAALTAPPRVRIRELDVRAITDERAYDAALAVDVLHHVPTEDHDELAGALARALKPGGVLLLKDIARTPPWRYEFNRFHDRLVTGDGSVHCRDPEDMAAVFARRGFTVERCERLHGALPYPHYLLRLRAGSGTGR